MSFITSPLQIPEIIKGTCVPIYILIVPNIRSCIKCFFRKIWFIISGCAELRGYNSKEIKKVCNDQEFTKLR